MVPIKDGDRVIPEPSLQFRQLTRIGMVSPQLIYMGGSGDHHRRNANSQSGNKEKFHAL